MLALNQIPLFSEIQDPNFERFAQELARRQSPQGQVIFKEGQSGQELYVILDGTVSIERNSLQGKPVAVSRLQAGEVLGEFAYLTGMPRTTSAIATTPVALLEISGSWLQSASGPYPVIEERLVALYRSRVLKNVLKTTKVFGRLEGGPLDHLVSQMKLLKVNDGTTIIREGDLSNNLFVIKRGRVAISKLQDGKVIPLGELGSGEILGEMALITGESRSASARAVGECEIMLMPGAVFKSLLEKVPALLAVIEDVIRSRAAQTRQILDSLVQEIVNERWGTDSDASAGLHVESLQVGVAFESATAKRPGRLQIASSKELTFELDQGISPPAKGDTGLLEIQAGRLKELRNAVGDRLTVTVVASDAAQVIVRIQEEPGQIARGVAIVTALARARLRTFIYPAYDTSSMKLTVTVRFEGGRVASGSLMSISQTHGFIQLDSNWNPGEFANIAVIKDGTPLVSCAALCMEVVGNTTEIQFEYESGKEKSELQNLIRDVSKRMGYGAAQSASNVKAPAQPRISDHSIVTLHKQFRDPKDFIRSYLGSMEAGYIRVDAKQPLAAGTKTKVLLAVSDGKRIRRMLCHGVARGWRDGIGEIHLENRGGELTEQLRRIFQTLIEQQASDKWEMRKRQFIELGVRIREAPNWYLVSGGAVALGIAVYFLAGTIYRTPETPAPSSSGPVATTSEPNKEAVPTRRMAMVPKRSSTKAEKMNVTEEPLTPEFVSEQKTTIQEGLRRQIKASLSILEYERDPKRITEIKRRIQIGEQALRQLETVDPRRPATWELQHTPTASE